MWMVEKRGMEGRGHTVLREKRDKLPQNLIYIYTQIYLYCCKILLPCLTIIFQNRNTEFNSKSEFERIKIPKRGYASLSLSLSWDLWREIPPFFHPIKTSRFRDSCSSYLYLTEEGKIFEPISRKESFKLSKNLDIPKRFPPHERSFKDSIRGLYIYIHIYTHACISRCLVTIATEIRVEGKGEKPRDGT